MNNYERDTISFLKRYNDVKIETRSLISSLGSGLSESEQASLKFKISLNVRFLKFANNIWNLMGSDASRLKQRYILKAGTSKNKLNDLDAISIPDLDNRTLSCFESLAILLFGVSALGSFDPEFEGW